MLKAEQLGHILGTILVSVAITALLMLEFDLTWKAGVAFYLIVFNIFRIVDAVAGEE